MTPQTHSPVCWARLQLTETTSICLGSVPGPAKAMVRQKEEPLVAAAGKSLVNSGNGDGGRVGELFIGDINMAHSRKPRSLRPN